MEAVDRIILIIHIIAGFSSLVTFMIPMFVKKGGNIHRKVGWVYVYNMWVVVLTATILSIINAVQGRYVSALFLGYLGIITAQPLWYGIVILKYKKEIPTGYARIRKYSDVLIVLLAVFNILVFIKLGGKGQSILLLIFGILGLTNIPMAIKSFSSIKESANWYLDHFTGMIAAGIAAYTAFFAFGGSTFFGNLFSGPWVAIPWVTPGILGVIVMKRFERQYKKKVKMT